MNHSNKLNLPPHHYNRFTKSSFELYLINLRKKYNFKYQIEILPLSKNLNELYLKAKIEKYLSKVLILDYRPIDFRVRYVMISKISNWLAKIYKNFVKLDVKYGENMAVKIEFD